MKNAFYRTLMASTIVAAALVSAPAFAQVAPAAPADDTE